MNEDLRAVRTLVVILLVSGGLRLGWQARSDRLEPGIGSPVDLAALVDSAERVEADEDRRAAPLAEGETLDLNSAPASELDRLPGVGPATAERIVAARSAQPFISVDDVTRVSGIGPATLAKFRSNVRVDPSHRASPTVAASGVGQARSPSTGPIDPNLASSDALQALPGIGPSLAERWIRHRKTNGPFRTPADLLGISGVGEATLERLRPWLIPTPWAARVAGE